MDVRLSEVERVSIEEVECALLDLTLALSFDTGELENALSSAGFSHDGCGCHLPRGAISHAHRGAHQGGAFARRLEALLDLLHKDALRRMDAAEDPGELLSQVLERDAWDCRELGGIAWAAARCGREELGRARACFARALALDAVRALAVRTLEGQRGGE